MPSGRGQIESGGTRRGDWQARTRRAARAAGTDVPASLAHAQLYSEELGIEIASLSDRELFKWFIASLLFGGRVTPRVAKQGYLALRRNRLLSPRRLAEAGETDVGALLVQAGYVRDARQKSASVVRASQKLCDAYQGSLQRLHDTAESPRQLEALLMEFPGVGPVTANIFLRELRPFWRKADPSPLGRVVAHMNQRGFDLGGVPRKSLRFARLEAGVVRELTKPGDLRKLGEKKKNRLANPAD